MQGDTLSEMELESEPSLSSDELKKLARATVMSHYFGSGDDVEGAYLDFGA